MRLILFLVSLSILAACADTSTVQPSGSAADIQTAADIKQPNVVVILADDVALMDFGIYGGEAATPNRGYFKHRRYYTRRAFKGT